MSLIIVDQAKVEAKARADRIAELKKLLAESDYVAMPDYDRDKSSVLADRQAWREEIRKLKKETK